jgi:hypothetical protein
VIDSESMGAGKRLGPRRVVTSSEEWVVGRRPAPFTVERPKPFRPDMLLVMDPDSELVVGAEAVAPKTSAKEAARWVEEAMGQQAPLPVRLRQPRQLRVDDEVFAAALRARLEPSIQVRTAPTPEVDRLIDHLGEDTGGRGEPTAAGLPADEETRTLPLFFEAAAALHGLAPWRVASDSDVLGLDVPDLGLEGACVSIIGNLGQSRGLLVFRSIVDYLAFTRFAAAHDQRRGRGALPPIHFFSINFDKPHEAPAGLVRMARKHRWALAAKDAFPYVLHVDPQGVALTLHESDFRLATVCLIGLARLLRKRPGIFSTPLRRPVGVHWVVKELSGGPKVRLTAPHPEATWQWGEESALRHLYETEAATLCEAFLTDMRSEGRTEDWIDGASRIVEQLLDFKLGPEDEGPLAWTSETVERFLFDHVPRTANLSDEQIQVLPDHLRSFLDWLGRTGREPVSNVERLIEGIEHRRNRFFREARDPAHFGIAKTLVRTMEREGVNLSDEKAVRRFMESFNERLRHDPTLLPLPFDVERGRTSSVSKPWVWTPGAPPPDATAPCPCGSGRRYKKCCLPR